MRAHVLLIAARLGSARCRSRRRLLSSPVERGRSRGANRIPANSILLGNPVHPLCVHASKPFPPSLYPSLIPPLYTSTTPNPLRRPFAIPNTCGIYVCIYVRMHVCMYVCIHTHVPYAIMLIYILYISIYISAAFAHTSLHIAI